MHSGYVYFCVECRIAQKSAGWNAKDETLRCSKNHKMQQTHYCWRAPKKNNIKAWQKIAEGNIWWDQKAIDKKARARYEFQQLSRVLARIKRRS